MDLTITLSGAFKCMWQLNSLLCRIKGSWHYGTWIYNLAMALYGIIVNQG